MHTTPRFTLLLAGLMLLAFFSLTACDDDASIPPTPEIADPQPVTTRQMPSSMQNPHGANPHGDMMSGMGSGGMGSGSGLAAAPIRLGISMINDAEAAQIEDGSTNIIGSLTPGGPAVAAGFQVGDRVVQVADTAVTDVHTYRAAVMTLSVGHPATVLIVRDGQPMALQVIPDGPAR